MSEKQTTKEKTLSQFDWDGDDENTFFGVTTPKEEVEKIVDEINEEEEEEEIEAGEEKKKVKLEDEEGEDKKKKSESFEFSKENEENEDEKISQEEFQTIASYQLDKFEHVEVEEDEEITPERLDELWEEEKDEYAKERVNQLAALGGDIFKRQMEFMKSGGTAEEFISQYKTVSDIPEFDIEKEDEQNKVIKYYLKNVENNDEKEIEDFFEYLEESGKKEAFAKRYNKKIVEHKTKRDKNIENKQREQKELRDQEREQFVDELETVLNDEESIGFKMSKENIADMPSYFSEQSVKTNNGRFITSFQKDLSNVFADKKKLAMLGFLMMNNMDMSFLEKKAASKVTRKVKSNLKTKVKTPASQSTSRKRSLSEFFR